MAKGDPKAMAGVVNENAYRKMTTLKDGIDIPDPKHKGSTIKICKGVYLEIEPGEIEAKTASTGETFKTRASQKETWVAKAATRAGQDALDSTVIEASWLYYGNQWSDNDEAHQRHMDKVVKPGEQEIFLTNHKDYFWASTVAGTIQIEVADDWEEGDGVAVTDLKKLPDQDQPTDKTMDFFMRQPAVDYSLHTGDRAKVPKGAKGK